MVLPTETTIKQETEDLEEDTNYTGFRYEVQVKVEIESSQVTEEVDWCIQNQTEVKHCENASEVNTIDYENLLEYSPQSCHLCAERYIDSFSLLCHNLTHLQLRITPITQQKYQCADCLQYFKTKSVLEKHILEKNLEPQQDLLVLEKYEPIKVGSFYKCKYCDTLMNYKNWHSHMRTVHAKGHYECMKCDSKFKCLRYLKRHEMYVHNGILRYKASQPQGEIKCSLCPAILAHKHALKTHMRNCHCEKVKCDICQSELKKSYLKNHIRRVHYDDGKEYKCYCGKKFRSPRYLKIHVKNSHKKQS